MIDLLLNQSGSVELDDSDDLAIVTGREAFEQSVALSINILTDRQIGKIPDETIKEKLRLSVKRVAEQYNAIEEIENVRIKERADGYNISVRYMTGEVSDFTFTI